MEYKYDAETDILVITLTNEKPDFAEQQESIITHYNKDGKPIEIEILDASQTASKITDVVFGTKKAIKTN
ncbi:DUF2283 domain-containing protein [Candidatus Pacearchaeota archaeon]|nr:DUF2283 domain-containing protein [Candidatus Pacearchaeota archaeon]